MQRAIWKVFTALAAMAAVGALSTAWPGVAQQPNDPLRQPTKSKDAQSELQRAAEELAKLKGQLDYFNSIYASKAAELAAAKKAADQQPKTIEQRLTEIEAKLDIVVAALGKKGLMVPPVASPGRPGTMAPAGQQGVAPPGMVPAIPAGQQGVAPVPPAPPVPPVVVQPPPV